MTESKAGFGAFNAGTLSSLGFLTLLLSACCWADSAISVAPGDDGIKHFAILNKEFVPIGVNYLRQHPGPPYQTFDMFDTKEFSPQAMDHELESIADSGFTFVRLWLKGIDADDGFALGPYKISDAYAANIIATLQSARRHGLYVVLTGAFRDGVWLPKNYLPLTPLPDSSVVGGMNRLIMLPAMAESLGQFFEDLLTMLQRKDPDILHTVFYIDAYNELHFDLAQPPLSKSTGEYVFEGRRYDLDQPVSRQALMDQAAQSWMRMVVSKIWKVTPDILVTTSTEFNVAFGHTSFDGGSRVDMKAAASPYPLRPAAYLQGGAELIDIHVYPSPARNGVAAFDSREDQALGANEITIGSARTAPLIVGEFGAYKSAYARPEQAVAELSATEQGFCRYHISGFAVWMWDGQGDTWTLQDEPLMKALAPRYNNVFCGRKIARSVN